jgi:hypothetical protein
MFELNIIKFQSCNDIDNNNNMFPLSTQTICDMSQTNSSNKRKYNSDLFGINYATEKIKSQKHNSSKSITDYSINTTNVSEINRQPNIYGLPKSWKIVHNDVWDDYNDEISDIHIYTNENGFNWPIGFKPYIMNNSELYLLEEI